MQSLAVRAYGQVRTRTVDERSLELAVFRQITQQLEAALSTDAKQISVRADALHRNVELWTLLTTDLLHPANGLDPELKRRLLGLGTFVRQATPAALSDEGGLQDLIDINTSIMEGLSLSGDRSYGA